MGCSVAVELIGDESRGKAALTLEELPGEAFRSQTVSSTLNQDVDRVAVVVYRPPQGSALPLRSCRRTRLDAEYRPNVPPFVSGLGIVVRASYTRGESPRRRLRFHVGPADPRLES